MIVFVERENGKVVGIYSGRCEGVAEEEIDDADAEVVAFLNPPPGPYSIAKMLLWTRLSDAEAETVDAAMASQPARLRGIWNSATEVRSDSEFFATLKEFLAAVLGSERAGQILQPEQAS